MSTYEAFVMAALRVIVNLLATLVLIKLEGNQTPLASAAYIKGMLKDFDAFASRINLEIKDGD